MKHGSPYGTHRVLEPLDVLPQGAWKIDNTMEIWDNEILIDVSALNIDAASFTQIKTEAGGDVTRVADIVRSIVDRRGKQHNPVTGSGGMLIGSVRAIGPALAGTIDGPEGDHCRVAAFSVVSPTAPADKRGSSYRTNAATAPPWRRGASPPDRMPTASHLPRLDTPSTCNVLRYM